MIVPAKLAFTADGTPYSEAYRDVYHAAAGGLEQALHVFLGGNDLPARWRGRDAFTIVETGFGLGLNFLAAWQAWLGDHCRCPRLHFVSFEKHPFSTGDLALAHRRWPELANLSAELRQQWPALVPGIQRLNFANGHLTLTLVLGDASLLVPQLMASADAYFIDGFAPAKNPELWSPQFLASLTRSAAPGATLATWSVAGSVREGLAACGWTLEKRAGFAGKREMLTGRHGEPRATAQNFERRALIIGAGLAGTSCAERLASRGWSVTIIDRQAGAGREGSGNPAGVLRPLPSMDDNYLARLTRAAYLHGRRHLQALSTAGLPLHWDACGVLHLARDSVNEENQRRLVERHQPPADYFSFVERDEAARLAAWPVQLGGWWFPGGGWVAPASLCRANLERHPGRIRALFERTAWRLERRDQDWQVFDSAGKLLAAAPVLILACAADALQLLPGLRLPLRVARGQVNFLPQRFMAPEVVVCRLGYVTPATAGTRSFGASFVRDNADEGLKIEETRGNLARLEFMLPGYARDVDPESLSGRAGFRAMTQDRLPLIGALPQADAVLAAAPGATMLSQYPRQSGLYGVLGLGARGLVWAALAGELLAAQLEGEPLPLERELVDAVDPARFLMRSRRRE